MSKEIELTSELSANLGTRRVPPLRPARFPDAGAVVQTLTSASRPSGAVDVLLANPPHRTAVSGSAASTGWDGAAART